jgi:hypothetical protein
MATRATRDSATTMPTEESPEVGVIVYADEPIFEAEHWIEDGEHVLRSTEFELVAGDSSLTAAVNRFVEDAEDLWGHLEETRDLTANELELVSLLAKRFRKILQVVEEIERRELERRIRISLRPRPLRSWHPQPSSSSQLSHA